MSQPLPDPAASLPPAHAAPPSEAEAAVRGLDLVAMLLSGLCLLHCLALPLLVALLPVAASSLVASEHFHAWMLLGVVPTSVLALGWGWRRHRSPVIAVLGLLGVALMSWAALGATSELADRLSTVAGAIALALAHVQNYRLRKQCTDCGLDHRH